MPRRYDFYGSHYDWMVEQLDELQRLAHHDNECKGPPECAWCLDELKGSEDDGKDE
jgi:hypothetical protein